MPSSCIATAMLNLNPAVWGRLPTRSSPYLRYVHGCPHVYGARDTIWIGTQNTCSFGGASSFSDTRQIPAAFLMRSVNEHRDCAQQPTFAESREFRSPHRSGTCRSSTCQDLTWNVAILPRAVELAVGYGQG